MYCIVLLCILLYCTAPIMSQPRYSRLLILSFFMPGQKNFEEFTILSPRTHQSYPLVRCRKINSQLLPLELLDKIFSFLFQKYLNLIFQPGLGTRTAAELFFIFSVKFFILSVCNVSQSDRGSLQHYTNSTSRCGRIFSQSILNKLQILVERH